MMEETQEEIWHSWDLNQSSIKVVQPMLLLVFKTSGDGVAMEDLSSNMIIQENLVLHMFHLTSTFKV